MTTHTGAPPPVIRTGAPGELPRARDRPRTGRAGGAMQEEAPVSEPRDWTPSTSRPDPDREPAITPQDVVAGLKAVDEGGPDLVQLLTPEGVRVPDPRF